MTRVAGRLRLPSVEAANFGRRDDEKPCLSLLNFSSSPILNFSSSPILNFSSSPIASTLCLQKNLPHEPDFLLTQSPAAMLDQMANEIKLISGSGHPELSGQIATRYVQDLLCEGSADLDAGWASQSPTR